MEIQRNVPLVVQKKLVPDASFAHDRVGRDAWHFAPNAQGAAVIIPDWLHELNKLILVTPGGQVIWFNARQEQPFVTWPVAWGNAFLAASERELLKFSAAGTVLAVGALERRVTHLVSSPGWGAMAVAYEGGGRYALFQIHERPFGLNLDNRWNLNNFEGRRAVAVVDGLVEMSLPHPTALELAIYNLARGTRAKFRLGVTHDLSWWDISPNGQLICCAANILHTASVFQPAEEIKWRTLPGEQIKAMMGGLPFHFERATSVSKSRSSPSVTFAGLVYPERGSPWLQWGVWWPERGRISFFERQPFMRIRALTAANGLTQALGFRVERPGTGPDKKAESWHPVLLTVRA